jgi:hypothetical protein
MDFPNPELDDQKQSSLEGKTISSSKPLHYSPARALMLFLSILLGVVVFLPLVTAAGIFGYQVYSWAKHGTWTVMTFAQFSSWSGLPPASYFSPDAWLGLKKAVQTIFRLPAALVLFSFSVVVALVGGIFQRR